MKFKQEKAEKQFSFWHKQKQFSTGLKFVDYLAEYNLQFPPDMYQMILKQKVFYNFIVKKRFLVAKDIINRYLVPLH